MHNQWILELNGKQCRSWSAGFFRSQLTRIYTVFKRGNIWIRWDRVKTVYSLFMISQELQKRILCYCVTLYLQFQPKWLIWFISRLKYMIDMIAWKKSILWTHFEQMQSSEKDQKHFLRLWWLLASACSWSFPFQTVWFVCSDSLDPTQQFFSHVFLGWTKQRLKCLGH